MLFRGLDQIQATEEEAALLYLFRCLDECGKSVVMNLVTFAYSQMTRPEILNEYRKTVRTDREE